MRTITHLYHHGAIELDCELEYDAGQKATLTDPPFPPAAYLTTAKVGGVDILPLLSEGLIQDIEKAAAWSMQS
jgi:hypothetical protein